jgi:hypothetical protein
LLPVWDVTRPLIGMGKVPLKFWLITRRNFAGPEWTAIPVSGECQMLHSEMLPPAKGSPAHVRGMLSLEAQLIEVIDLARLSARPAQATPETYTEETTKEGLK